LLAAWRQQYSGEEEKKNSLKRPRNLATAAAKNHENEKSQPQRMDIGAEGVKNYEIRRRTRTSVWA